jgi:hypothetical protein
VSNQSADLVSRLRAPLESGFKVQERTYPNGDTERRSLLQLEAADEIERLRQKVDDLKRSAMHVSNCECAVCVRAFADDRSVTTTEKP